MEDIIKTIGSSFSEMGALLTFLAILTISIMTIFKKSISKKIEEMKLVKGVEKNKVKKRFVKDLWSHDIFITIEVVKAKIAPMRFTTHGEYDEIKTKLLKILINNQIDNFQKRLSEFINKDKIDELDGQKLKFSITENIKNGAKEYNTKSKKEFISLGITEEDATFLIDEYGYFRDEVQSGVFERVDSITTNSNYYNNYDRMSAVFEVLAMGLFLIPKDSQAACNNINGRFRKYVGRM